MASKAWGRDINVLFLCDSNCGRSLMAQAILEREGEGHFQAFSAGAHPASEPNPIVIDLLGKLGHETAHLTPKSWSTYAHDDSPEMDFIFTMCDESALEHAPEFPGVPVTSNWDVPSASLVSGSEAVRYAAFDETYAAILRRVRIFTNLPFAALDSGSLHAHLTEIGSAG